MTAHDENEARGRFIDAAWFSKDPPKIGQPPKLTFHRNFEAMGRKRYVVDDFLAEGEVSCFYGEPGATKGTIAVDIACHVAAGIPWMERNAGNFTGEHGWWPAGVLYIALERSPQVQRRVEAFTSEKNLQEPLDLAIWTGPLDLVGSEYDDILTAIFEHQRYQEEHGGGCYRDVKLVVIDTLARAFGSGSDSGGEETAAVARKLERVLRFMPDLHIMIVHHTPIGDDTRLRGHGNLLAAFDQTVRVRKHKAGSTATVIKDNDTPESAKAKFAYALENRVLHVDKITGKETTAPIVVPLPLEAIKLALPKTIKASKKTGPKASKSEQPVYDALSSLDAPASEDVWREAYDAAKEDGITQGNHRTRFSRGKASLEKKGLITKDAAGNWSVTVSALQPENCNS